MDAIKNVIYEVMVYVNFHLYDHLTLDIISDKFSYSKYHLHRKFKEVVGITLNQYIRKTRIENSIYFLFANPDTDISEIAGYCGFSSSTYSREFKKVFDRSPKEWRSIYKKGAYQEKESKICKNYESFICYDDSEIPEEIKEIGVMDFREINLCAIIYYGSYYDRRIMDFWEEIGRLKPEDKPYIGVPINSPAVTALDSCLYLVGFESDSTVPGLTSAVIEGGRYITVDYRGSRVKLRDAHTWLLKYYMPGRSLKYDYRVQFYEYPDAPDYRKDETSCRIYIPIFYS